MQIVLATQNLHKIREILEIWGEVPFEVLTLKDFPNFPNVIEDGKTYAENSLKKAREICQFTGLTAVADDSGIEVAALDGGPGLYSARFAGESATDAERNQHLLNLLKDYPRAHSARKACFRCVASIVTPEGAEYVAEGSVDGEILDHWEGQQGFGYDPIFYLPERGVTTAQLSLEEKNLISHRGKAFRRIQEVLLKVK